MVLINFQTTTQVEIDTETGKQRLVKSWTRLLGVGNGGKKPKAKVKTLDTDDVETEVLL